VVVPKYFTREEAEARLAELRPLVEGLQREKLLLDELRAQAKALEARLVGDGDRHQANLLAQRREAIQHVERRMADGVERLEAFGVAMKDLEMGLVDFLSLRDGREVYLCWRLGEPRIGWWHPLDSGFAGRQPL
jgi:hypothetical protein